MPNTLQPILWPTALDHLIQTSEEIVVDANTDYFLSDSDAVFFVQQNTGDIFAAEKGNPSFTPLFLQEVHAGDLLFGLSPQSGQTPHALFFVSPLKTILHKVSLIALRKLIEEDTETRQWMAVAIEKWVGNLLTQFDCEHPKECREIGLEEAMTLQAGENLCLHKTIHFGQKRVLAWIECIVGELEEENAHIVFRENEGLFFPLSPSLWLTAKKESRLISHPTEKIIAQDRLWRGIISIHHQIFSSFVRKQEIAVQKNILKMSKKRQTEEQLEKNVFESLGSLLQKKHIPLSSPEDDLLFQACDLLGQVIGVKIHRPSTPFVHREERIHEICTASGIFYRKVALKGEWWRTVHPSFVAFYGEEKRPVVLIRVGTNQFDVQDPREPKRMRLTEEMAKQLDSEGFVFLPEIPTKKVSFFSLMRFSFAEAHRDMASLFVIAILIGILNLFLPFAMKVLFDVLAAQANTVILKQLSLGLLLAGVSKWIFSISQQFAWQRMEGISGSQLDLGLWSHILKLPASFFRAYRSGDVLYRYFSLKRVHQLVNDNGVPVFFSLIFASLYLIEMLIFSPILSLFGFLSFFLIAIVLIYGMVAQIHLHKRLIGLSGQIASFVKQMISGIEKIRIAGAENRFFAVWSKLFVRKKKLDLHSQKLRMMNQLITTIFPFVSLIIIYSVAIYIFEVDTDATNKRLTIGNFVGFATAFILFVASGLLFFQKGAAFAEIPAYWENGKSLLEFEPEGNLGQERLQKFKGKIIVDNISYRYNEREGLVLDNVSLFADPGELVAIVGPSGAGKSTLIRLLLGFEQPEHGGIFFDDINLEDLDSRVVRSQVGTILQNATLIPGSIYDNIVGDRIYSTEEVERAMYLSGFEQDLKSFPRGLRTIISRRGEELTRGQMQRLFLARALVSSPKVLLLDEAMNALDDPTQKFISKNLELLQITQIVMTHRLSTVKNADRIYVMEKGKVVRSGSFTDVITS